MITSTAHAKGIAVTASAEGVPTAIRIEPAELRFGAQDIAIRVLELTWAAARSALEELR